MRRVGRVLIALLLFALIQTAVGRPIFKNLSAKSRLDSTGPQIKVLFIGNSYTYFNDLPSMVSRMAASRKGSKLLETSSVTKGGATLKRHWEEATALERLKQARWDYVVLQEQSLLPVNDRDKMHRYARLFDAEIKKAGAKTVFYLT